MGKAKEQLAKVDRKDGQRTRDVILSMISEDGRVTSHKMAEAVGINRSAISNHLY